MKTLLYIITGLSLYAFISIFLIPYMKTIITLLRIKKATKGLKNCTRKRPESEQKKIDELIKGLEELVDEGLKTKI